MRADAFDRLARHDVDGWWFVAKQQLALQALRPAPPGPVIDVGCGTGGTLVALGDAGIHPAVGVDLEGPALDHLRQRLPSAPVVQAAAGALPLRTGTARAIVSMDVIEHLDDDVAALEAYGAALRPGGEMVIVVPAYMWAWTPKDDRLGHRRRYTRARLRAALESAGLDVQRVTHFHLGLVPPAFLVAKTPARRLLGSGANEAGTAGARVNRLLLAVGRAERWLLRRLDAPFGLSILAVATKPGP